MSKKQPEALRLAEMLKADEWPGNVTPVGYVQECVAELLRHQYARITELESQLAQRFDAADKATAAAQGFRDGGASLTAQAAESAQEDLLDAARLDFLIDQRAYVVSDPDACPGHWLHWARPDGSTWVQVNEHPTPRAAIDAARKQGGAR